MDFKYYPKVELHAHLSGSISDETIKKMIEKNTSLSENTLKEITSILEMKGKRSLKECFRIFALLHSLTENIDNVKMCTYDVIKEFSEDNVLYLELRTTPKNVSGNYTKREYIEAVLETVREAEKSLGIVVRILVSIDRSRGVEDAWDTLKLVKDLRKHDTNEKYIRGIDVSGHPSKGSLIEYLPVLKEVRKLGLKSAVHLLEVNEPFAFEEAKAIFSEELVDRIGHGTFLHEDSGGSTELTNLVLEKKIPIEICITSNLKSGSVIHLESHHVKWWKRANHPITVSTDDKGVFSTSLSEELSLYCKAVNGNAESDVVNMLSTSLEASFLEEEEKQALRNRISDFIKSLRLK